MADHSLPPFSSRGIRVHWGDIFKLLTWLIPLLAVGSMLYLSSIFATQEQMRQTVQAFESLPPRVDKLEDFKIEQKSQQQATTAQVGIIQNDIASMRATLTALKEESKSNTDRILQRLDTISRNQ